jgi:hypothetical protein
MSEAEKDGVGKLLLLLYVSTMLGAYTVPDWQAESVNVAWLYEVLWAGPAVNSVPGVEQGC